MMDVSPPAGFTLLPAKPPVTPPAGFTMLAPAQPPAETGGALGMTGGKTQAEYRKDAANYQPGARQMPDVRRPMLSQPWMDAHPQPWGEGVDMLLGGGLAGAGKVVKPAVTAASKAIAPGKLAVNGADLLTDLALGHIPLVGPFLGTLNRALNLAGKPSIQKRAAEEIAPHLQKTLNWLKNL